MSVRRLAEQAVQPGNFAFAAMVAAVMLASPTPAGADGKLVSADLLRIGFKPVAEGDLLVERIFYVDRMNTGVGAWASDSVFVAEVPSISRPTGGQVIWVKDRYDSYVRLRRGDEEFVCVIGPSEHCHRAASSSH